ncbi:hypothetical protein QLS71_011125 [Mariniflexile litorale]|uniref:Uncharacterized protein n=1 Tax=Mariniflexile litorale TaxID=3045158 RepID=A0AAU7ECJ9_9FLAO|nr:hypothetical protein [Mariniflexile sp. KMM 9835]MDQ8212615.1 hypothetical protein [Mariniflexile sp. KMM 9835]
METNKDIQNKIDSTLNVIDAIETANVSPFFKDKTMQRLFTEKEEIVTTRNWFSPKLQLATLSCVVILNVIAFTQIKASSYDENINEFADTYGFSTSTETSFLN